MRTPVNQHPRKDGDALSMRGLPGNALPLLLGRETFHDVDDGTGIRDSDVRVNDVPLPVKDELRRRGAHAVHLGHRQAGGCSDINPDELGTALQLLCEPVHDRLGHQAGRSAVGEEINHGRLSRLHLALELGRGGERRARTAQRKPGQWQANDDQQAYPVLT